MPSPQTVLQVVADAGLSVWDAEPFLKKVTDIVPGIIYIFNQKTQSNEYTNRSIGQAMGYTEQEIRDMGAALIPTICHPEDLSLLVDHFDHVKRLKDGEVIKVDYRVRHKSGSWVWLMSHDTVFSRDMDGSVLRHIGVANDITLIKDTERLAQAEQRKAQTINDELSAFAYSLSHDMKGPTNTLMLLLTELTDSHHDTLVPDAAELIALARETVQKMGQLIDDVTDYTGVINQEVVMETVATECVVNDILRRLASRIRQAGATVTIQGLRPVKADASQLHLYLHHMLDNALHFRDPARAPVITVSGSVDEDLQTLALTVQDNGLGIEEDQQDKVFTIFKRLHTNVDKTGTGMGLAICRRIAANHGSEIALASRPGAGAAFTIGLPLA